MDLEEALAALGPLEERPPDASYAGVCSGGPWHGREVESVCGRLVVLDPSWTKGFYGWSARYRIWQWLGWAPI